MRTYFRCRSLSPSRHQEGFILHPAVMSRLTCYANYVYLPSPFAWGKFVGHTWGTSNMSFFFGKIISSIMNVQYSNFNFGRGLPCLKIPFFLLPIQFSKFILEGFWPPPLTPPLEQSTESLFTSTRLPQRDKTFLWYVAKYCEHYSEMDIRVFDQNSAMLWAKNFKKQMLHVPTFRTQTVVKTV